MAERNDATPVSEAEPVALGPISRAMREKAEWHASIGRRRDNVFSSAEVLDLIAALAKPVSEAGGELRAQITPFSSVVGQSVLLTDETGAALAQLSISIPDPNKPYRETAEEIARVIELAINQPPSAEVKRLRVRLGDLMIEDAKRMAALAKPASSPAGGDVARALLDALSEFEQRIWTKDMGLAWKQHVQPAIREFSAALSQSTSAGRVGE